MTAFPSFFKLLFRFHCYLATNEHAQNQTSFFRRPQVVVEDFKGKYLISL